MNLSPFKVIWREDGGCTLLARVTARDGTGAWTGVRGEGNWVKQADLAAQGTGITCSVFDRSAATPDTATATPTVTITSAIQDTPVTNGYLWDVDDVGWNFLFDLAGTNFPTGGKLYRIEVTFTTTGSVSWTDIWEGPAVARSTG